MSRIVKSARFLSDPYRIALPLEPIARDGPALDAGFFSDAMDAIGEPPMPMLDASPEPSLDHEALIAQAEALVESAHADAKEILASTLEAAKALLALSHERVAEIETHARESGHIQGEHDAREAVDAQMSDMLSTMRGLVEMAREERHSIIKGAEHEILRLCVAIAERIVHRVIAEDDQVVVETTRTAISRFVNHERITVRVNPADLESIREHRERLTSASDLEDLRIVADQRVDRGGVMIDTVAANIDGRITTQLREVHRVLDISEPIEVPESAESAALLPPAQAG